MVSLIGGIDPPLLPGSDSDVDWRIPIDDHTLSPGVWQEGLFRKACWTRRMRARKGLPDDAICSPYLRLSAASSPERHEMYIFDLIYLPR